MQIRGRRHTPIVLVIGFVIIVLSLLYVGFHYNRRPKVQSAPLHESLLRNTFCRQCIAS